MPKKYSKRNSLKRKSIKRKSKKRMRGGSMTITASKEHYTNLLKKIEKIESRSKMNHSIYSDNLKKIHKILQKYEENFVEQIKTNNEIKNQFQELNDIINKILRYNILVTENPEEVIPKDV